MTVSAAQDTARTPSRWADLLDRPLLDRPSPVLMGILNVTPDSFSDGGRFNAPDAARDRIAALREAGAHIIDIGGESTRPGAEPVDPAEEIRRVTAALDAADAAGDDGGAVFSIDTRNAAVMKAALARLQARGAPCIVNDVSALTHDPQSLETVAAAEAMVVLMHMQGDPATMNDDPRYDDVVAEVRDYLAGRAAAAIAGGVDPGRIAIDPGLGFAKTHAHNLALLHGLRPLIELGYPVLVGASRKLAAWSAADSVRLAASTTAAVVAAQQGASVLRVHDVAETRAALRVAGFGV